MLRSASGRVVGAVLLIIAGETTSSSQQVQAGAPGYVIIQNQGAASLQQQNPYLGSVPESGVPGNVLALSLLDAVQRGLKQNLGLLLSADAIPAARGQRWRDLSELLPNLTTETSESAHQVNLRAVGINLHPVGINAPTVVGPFGVFDTRAYLTQSVFDWKSIQQARSGAQQVRVAKYSYLDSRELVVFAVASAYLQTIADSARVDTAAAQRDTAQALYQQAADQLTAGTTAKIDVLRADVERQSREQQLIAATNAFAKQKIVLARVIGLPPGQEFTLTDAALYSPPSVPSLEDALGRAYATRADYKSAMARVRAAELARSAAVAGYYPSVTTAVDYGDIGPTPGQSHGTVNATATLNVPIFQGGRVHGDVLLAEAVLRQGRELLGNTRAQIDQDVRNAYLDLQSAAEQLRVAHSSVDLANETLQQARDRFAAGVTDNIEVVQAQQSVASANESLISSLYYYNVSRVALERAIGHAEAGVQQIVTGR